MKAKYNVSIMRESAFVEVMDETFAKEALMSNVQLKMNPFEHTVRSEIKIDKEKIHLKNNRKWFNKYKAIKLDQIMKFFVCDMAPEYILIYVAIEDFSGYIVLKIDIASSMLSFIEILKSSLNHSESTNFVEIVIGNGDKPKNDISQPPDFEWVNSVEVEVTETPITNGIHHDKEASISNEFSLISQNENKSLDSVDSANFSAENNSLKKGKIIIVDGDTITYVNSNVKGIVVDDGPVSLYSKTYPSSYNRTAENGMNCYDSVESLSDSTNGDHDMF